MRNVVKEIGFAVGCVLQPSLPVMIRLFLLTVLKKYDSATETLAPQEPQHDMLHDILMH